MLSFRTIFSPSYLPYFRVAPCIPPAESEGTYLESVTIVPAVMPVMNGCSQPCIWPQITPLIVLMGYALAHTHDETPS